MSSSVESCIRYGGNSSAASVCVGQQPLHDLAIMISVVTARDEELVPTVERFQCLLACTLAGGEDAQIMCNNGDSLN